MGKSCNNQSKSLFQLPHRTNAPVAQIADSMRAAEVLSQESNLLAKEAKSTKTRHDKWRQKTQTKICLG